MCAVKTLQGVSETLLIPLAARVLESRRRPAEFQDPLSAEFLRLLEVDVSPFAKDRWNMAGAMARTVILDRAVSRFLRDHPRALVINLGAGLCSRYWRLGVPAGARWIDVDLPEVIELKRQLLRTCEENGSVDVASWASIPVDVTSAGWMEKIEKKRDESVLVIAEGLLMYLPEPQVQEMLNRFAMLFPGGTMLLEAWSPFVRYVWGSLSSSIRRTGSQIRWGLGAPKTLERWNSRIRVEECWFPGDVNPQDWGLLRIAPRIRRSLMKILQLRFAD